MGNKFDIFPDDKEMRTVVSYGKIHKGYAETQTVSVDIKKLDTGEREIYPVLLTDLFKIKIGAMFKGQEELDKYYSDYDAYRYEENLQFSFDFNEIDPTNVIFTKSKNEFERETEQPYDNSTVNNLKPQNNTVYAKLENESGITVYVPSLELLVSGYSPERRSLISDLCRFPLNVAVQYFEKRYRMYDREYFFKRLREEDVPEKYSCTNYLKHHPVSRPRASIIWTSIELTRKDNISSYVSVLPYHPEKMTITVSGFWIDEKRFMVQRIDKVLPPSGHKTVPPEPFYETDSDDCQEPDTFVEDFFKALR